jgi:hypothetical protein
MVVKVKERIYISKLGMQKFYMERINLKIIKNVDVKEHYQTKTTQGLQLWKT